MVESKNEMVWLVGEGNPKLCKGFSVRIKVENESSRKVRPINVCLIQFLPEK